MTDIEAVKHLSQPRDRNESMIKPMTEEMREWTQEQWAEFAKSPDRDPGDLRGIVCESHKCVDCGYVTLDAPERVETEKLYRAGEETFGAIKLNWETTETYFLRPAIWAKIGMKPHGGCLCVGCLQKRALKHLGRRIKPKDFDRNHPFNQRDYPGSPRLKKAQGW
jgi:hypothetical protein